MSSAPDAEGRLRVLWLTKGLGPGGAERLLESSAAIVDHERFTFSAAYLLRSKSHLAPVLRKAGIEVTCLDVDTIADPRWLFRLWSLLRRDAVDVVHVHAPLVAGLARPLLRSVRPAPAIVTTEHNVWHSFHPVTRALDRFTSPLDAHRFSVSAQVHESLPRRMRAGSEVLVHGVDVDGIAARGGERDGARDELGVGDRPVVVTVANLRADKDHPNLLAAAALVADRLPEAVFLVVGQGPLEDELRGEIAKQGLTDTVRLLGHRRDPIRVLAAADVFALASRNEGLPIALLEALAIGLPVVATAVGGVPEVVTEGVEGRLVPVADPAALAAGLVEVLEGGLPHAGAAASRRARDFGILSAVERQQECYLALRR